MARPQWRPRQTPGPLGISVDPTLAVEFERDLAWRWHRQGDHVLRGVGLGEEGCTCLDIAGRLRALVTDLLSVPMDEPAGLGAVVCNPLPGGVWVRASHPRLPWRGAEAPTQDWTDPTSEAWFAWSELPRPLLLRTEGWEPPARSSPEAGISPSSPPSGAVS